MSSLSSRPTSTFLLTLAASICTIGTAATNFAQDPATEPDAAPVRKELDEFREKASKKCRPSDSKPMSRESRPCASPA